MRPRFALLLAAVVALLGIALPAAAQATADDGAVVHGVLFFSPTCGHCHKVITEDLPVIYEEHGGAAEVSYDETADPADVAFYLMSNGTLELLLVDVSVEAGSAMFVADSEALGIEQAGVPRLDIANTYLVGSAEIPDRLPGIIEQGISDGGLPWPDIAGIEEALASVPGATAPADAGSGTAANPGDEPAGGDAAEVLPSGANDSVLDRIARDPVGNGLAIAVLTAMIVSVFAVVVLARRDALTEGPIWLVPTLAIVGIAVSVYLASVETSGAEAVCGPVGDCNAVQQSAYASILGVPIGVLGVVGYAALLLGWALAKSTRGRLADWGAVLAAGIGFGGTIFSIYLTFLEPFVIGATCIWCLTSAVAITALLWLTAGPGLRAMRRMGTGGSKPPADERELVYG